jgi:hypothetical protein
MLLHRRSFLVGGLVSLLAAPAIVRAASLMPVKALEPLPVLSGKGWAYYRTGDAIERWGLRLTEKEAAHVLRIDGGREYEWVKVEPGFLTDVTGQDPALLPAQRQPPMTIEEWRARWSSKRLV